MKKSSSFLLILISLSLILASCGKDKDLSINYQSIILGTWKVNSQETIVSPASTTEGFNFVFSIINQNSSYRANSDSDSISQITFSDSIYAVIVGKNAQYSENSYILDGDLLTLNQENSGNLLLKISYMNNQRAILYQDILTMADIESLFNGMKANLEPEDIISIQTSIDNLKRGGFEKTLLKRTLIRVV